MALAVQTVLRTFRTTTQQAAPLTAKSTELNATLQAIGTTAGTQRSAAVPAPPPTKPNSNAPPPKYPTMPQTLSKPWPWSAMTTRPTTASPSPTGR